MQNETLTQILPIINTVVTLASVVGIVHVLQERFTKFSFFKKNYKSSYYMLRGSLSLLAAIQLGALMCPFSWPLFFSNICTTTIAAITTKYFN